MHDGADFVIEDRVILVLAILGEALVASLAAAVELLVAEIPAAGTLQQVAADRGHIADVRRGRVQCGIGENLITLADYRMLGDRGQSHHGPEAQPSGLFLHVVEIGDGTDVDQASWGVQAFFQAIHQVDTAGFGQTLIVELPDGIIDGAGIGPFKTGNHAIPPCFTLPSAVRTRAGVIGSSYIRTPVALYTALATAAAPGIFAGSPIPPASVELRAR